MKSRLLGGGLALLLSGLGVPAAAALGEDLGSVQAEAARMQAVLEVGQEAGYAVHLLRLPSGTVVRQYVSSAGMVFAVSWQGPALPDLRQLLGRYFDAYVEAVKSRGPGASRSMRSTALVVQTGGHMRAYFGRVYVPQMLPRGVSAERIQ